MHRANPFGPPNSGYQLWTTDHTLTDEQVILQEISIPKPNFSLDVVPASLRQREHTTESFTNVTVSIPRPTFKTPSHATTNSCVSCPKKYKITGENIPLVPTLDVDLAWHTHQLYPHSYGAYCLEFVGRMVNHDDTFEKVVIGNRLRETNLAWLKAYHEPYIIKDLRKEFCTTKGKIVGVMFPPYGIVIFQKVTFINLTIKSPQLQKIWFQGIV